MVFGNLIQTVICSRFVALLSIYGGRKVYVGSTQNTLQSLMKEHVTQCDSLMRYGSDSK